MHGKDLSKADVSVNIYAFLKAQQTGKSVELCCAIGDDTIDGKSYAEIVETARKFISELGGFEKFAEWGLYIEQVGSSDGVTVLRDGQTHKYEEIANEQ